MIEALIDKSQRHHLDRELLGEHPMRFEARPDTVSRPQNRLGIAIAGPPERVAFAFEGQCKVRIRDVEPGGFGPGPIQAGFGFPLGHAEGRRHEGLVQHQAAVGREAHVGQAGRRLDGVHVRMVLEDRDQRVPLPHGVRLGRRADVAGHPGIDDVLDPEMGRWADQQSRHVGHLANYATWHGVGAKSARIVPPLAAERKRNRLHRQWAMSHTALDPANATIRVLIRGTRYPIQGGVMAVVIGSEAR